MDYISPKKQRFVDFIRDFTHENNRPPTFVEIMSGLDIRSLGTVNWYVNTLEKQGYLYAMIMGLEEGKLPGKQQFQNKGKIISM